MSLSFLVKIPVLHNVGISSYIGIFYIFCSGHTLILILHNVGLSPIYGYPEHLSVPVESDPDNDRHMQMLRTLIKEERPSLCNEEF